MSGALKQRTITQGRRGRKKVKDHWFTWIQILIWQQQNIFQQFGSKNPITVFFRP